MFQSLRKGKYPSKFQYRNRYKFLPKVSIPEKREIPFEVKAYTEKLGISKVSIPEKREIPFEAFKLFLHLLLKASFNP